MVWGLGSLALVDGQYFCDIGSVVFNFGLMTFVDLFLRIVVSIIGACGLLGFFYWKESDRKKAIVGLLVSIAAIYISGQSVLTSGTATLSAILFILSQWVSKWRKSIYQSFFIVYKIIWLGIGINAVFNIGSVFWGWGDLKIASPSWFFAEAMFAIIILNGVYIGKVLGPAIANVLKTDQPPSEALVKKITASGSLSFVSWYAWILSRKGFLEFWNISELLSIWFGFVLFFLGFTILLETLRKTINARNIFRA